MVPLPSEEGESLPATEGLPIAGVLFETNRVDSPAAPPAVALEPAEPKSAERKAAEMTPAELGEVALQEPATQEAPLEAALAEASLNEVTLKEDALEDVTARPRALELEEQDAEVPLIEALDLAPAARDLRRPRCGRRRVPRPRGRESEAGAGLAACGRALVAGSA